MPRLFIYFFKYTFCVAEKVLVQLNLTLVSKSDAYADASLRSIFRLNNSHYLLGALQRTGLLQLLKVSFTMVFILRKRVNLLIFIRLPSIRLLNQNVRPSTVRWYLSKRDSTLRGFCSISINFSTL